MATDSAAELLSLLGQAIRREVLVSAQYMFQHAVASGQWPAIKGKSLEARRAKFLASDSMYWLPGATLKKVAITEMRHAEAIAKRVVSLGGDPTPEAAPVVLGETGIEMLEMDRDLERSAIELYGRIIDLAAKMGDAETSGLFRSILADEEKHLQMFSGLVGTKNASR